MMIAPEATMQITSQEINIGKRFLITSEILGEERPYLVYLPPSYYNNTISEKSYPVLYLLDGDAYFHFASGVVQFMSSNMNAQIPELIIVAIPNTNRIRDLTPTNSKIDLYGNEAPYLEGTGGGDIFMKFIYNELCPEIDSNFRTLNYKIVVGHSGGGLMALHSLLESPEIFQAYIAIDPSLWWDNQVLVHRAENVVKNNGNINGSVFISTANHDLENDSSNAMDKSCQSFANYLASVNSPGFRSKLEYFGTEDHLSIPLLSLYHGLLYIFEGYKPSGINVNEPSAIKIHFEHISERLGINLLPPEGMVNQMGYVQLAQTHDADKAIEFFKLNETYYPKSYNVYDSLGEANIAADKKLQAIKYYEKSLELNPDNENAKMRIQELKNQKDEKNR